MQKEMAFMTVDEFALKFKMKKQTVRACAKSGKIPGARRIGGRWYFHEEAILKYFESAAGPQDEGGQ